MLVNHNFFPIVWALMSLNIVDIIRNYRNMTVIIHLLEYHLDDFLDIHQLTLDCLFFNTAKDIKTSK
jgi:hypothetical protein